MASFPTRKTAGSGMLKLSELSHNPIDKLRDGNDSDVDVNGEIGGKGEGGMPDDNRTGEPRLGIAEDQTKALRGLREIGNSRPSLCEQTLQENLE